MMRWKWIVCAVAALALASSGCKSNKKVATYVPPEPYPTVADTDLSSTPGGDVMSPEPVVGPTYTGEDTVTPYPGTGSVGVTIRDPEPDVSESPVSAGQSYVVRKGDTLYALARRFYNDQRKWRLIYDANRAAVPNPNSIKVGQTLSIPPAE